MEKKKGGERGKLWFQYFDKIRGKMNVVFLIELTLVPKGGPMINLRSLVMIHR